ncbi:uncharacterized protein BO95DRAFT_174367 [Aspergillus brunneoviolaceus CBS 621.78]|uniref:Uncharacterized protein n=1 Tax=Aspergillus brunneoviolaceus CBS 621.78 TaxID=1450534 RepID=A0ACD1G5H4_9EURO|nr:hypothetical protein BO95DRAFT_174367 [Aspergillus brunneoviolaceus CBS 621.78]RAH44517.1 hypothetical protein BO95DRAFT_174367 [Aspergillus brunneoviolaceus CBS 621.78]
MWILSQVRKNNYESRIQPQRVPTSLPLLCCILCIVTRRTLMMSMRVVRSAIHLRHALRALCCRRLGYASSTCKPYASHRGEVGCRDLLSASVCDIVAVLQGE